MEKIKERPNDYAIVYGFVKEIITFLGDKQKKSYYTIVQIYNQSDIMVDKFVAEFQTVEEAKKYLKECTKKIYL